ncbi:expressed unknown protein [Seminavis robusta]|uniref:Metallo-beta-lactamase domain-containing protein n=1 Tax=Seminavis robusta TaxID=568900 RepID=A0A9N8EVN6_9STRA|nr:expressed unknown protein [Seminavis robusta]|eukprot:Sro2014_g311030.1 n/a (590) ;mRNA; f:14910-16679
MKLSLQSTVLLCLALVADATISSSGTRQLAGLSPEEIAAQDPSNVDGEDEEQRQVPAVLELVVNALGGQDALMDVSLVEYLASGATFVAYEGATPESLVNVSTYDRFLQFSDLLEENLRVRVEETIQPLFETFRFFPPANTTRTAHGDGGIGPVGVLEGSYLFAANGTMPTASAVALIRQTYLFNPHVFLKSVLLGSANLLEVDDDTFVYDDFISPITFTIDTDTGFIDSLTLTESNDLLGDVTVTIAYSNWSLVTDTGLVFPAFVQQTVNEFVFWQEERYFVQSYNNDNTDIKLDELFELPPGTNSTVDFDSYEYGLTSHHLEAVWFMTGFYSFPFNPTIGDPVEIIPNQVYVIPSFETAQSVVVYFNNGTSAILIEAPSSAQHGATLVNLVQEELAPLPGSTVLTHLIQSHHHIDHSSAVREVMGETMGNAELIVGHGVEEWWRTDVFDAPSTLLPDAWAYSNLTGDDAMIFSVQDAGANVLVNETDLKVFVASVPAEHAEDMVVTLIETPQGLYVYVADLYNAGIGFTVALGGPQEFFDFLRSINVIDDACQSDFPLFFIGAHGLPTLSLEDALEEFSTLGVDVGC